MQVVVDISQLYGYSKKLKSLSKSAFPVAIRQTLTDAAKKVKTGTMPERASATFKKRQPNFFKANSKYIPAQGFKVNAMKAEVGFFSNQLRGKNNAAVKDLEEQERGGNIDRKTFIAEEGARGGSGLVKPQRRLGNMPNLLGKVAVSSGKGMVRGKLRAIKSKKQRFIRAAFMAKKKFGGFVLGGKNNNGSKTLSIITSISSSGGSINIKRAPLYNVNKGRVVKVKATNFMKRASYESGLQMNNMFIKNAQSQFLKHLSK